MNKLVTPNTITVVCCDEPSCKMFLEVLRRNFPKGLVPDFHVVEIPGGAMCLGKGSLSERDAAVARVREGIKLSYSDRVILLAAEDCGHHGSSAAFASADHERVVVGNCLDDARVLLRDAIPGVEVSCVFGSLCLYEVNGLAFKSLTTAA